MISRAIMPDMKKLGCVPSQVIEDACKPLSESEVLPTKKVLNEATRSCVAADLGLLLLLLECSVLWLSGAIAFVGLNGSKTKSVIVYASLQTGQTRYTVFVNVSNPTFKAFQKSECERHFPGNEP